MANCSGHATRTAALNDDFFGRIFFGRATGIFRFRLRCVSSLKSKIAIVLLFGEIPSPDMFRLLQDFRRNVINGLRIQPIAICRSGSSMGII